MRVTILERDDELAALADAAREAGDGAGSVVLVSGEAGIGKSSLVDAVPDVLPRSARLLVGYCDDLGTPRVLGPLRDLAGSVGSRLTGALQRVDRAAVMDALLEEIELGDRPTVLIVEDVHWADEATLDVLRYLVRRSPGLPLALVLTYRDDEVPVGHPLRPLLALASRVARVRRLRLARLSPAAVRQLSAQRDVDPERVFGVTAGNPYFVTEVLASGDAEAVPLTIADAVRARLGHLGAPAFELVQRLAVVPSAVEPWLLDALDPDASEALAEAEQWGLLSVSPTRIAFRHELTRRAVEDAMPKARRIAENRRVLAALLARPAVEVSRVVHHAARAGDVEVILEFGPLAADEASAAGAHRQAAAHLRLVLDQNPVLEPAREADLWEAYGIESYRIDSPTSDARDALEVAVELRRGGDPRALGETCRWLSRIYWWAGDLEAAARAADEAAAVLAEAADDGGLAMALSNQSQLHALAGRDTEAIVLAERALELGSHVPATRSHALNNIAHALSRTDHERAVPVFLESLDVALQADEAEHACRAYVNMIWRDLEALELADAELHVTAAIDFAERAELFVFSRYLQFELSLLDLANGSWDDVVPAAALALDGAPAIRASALTVIGRMRARRGDPDAADMLREAWQLAVRYGECQRVAPAAAALAEAAVLSCDVQPVMDELAFALDMAAREGSTSMLADLTYWLHRLGAEVSIPDSDHPYAALARGEWLLAAKTWGDAGLPYENAVALTYSRDPDDLLAALVTFDALGALPMAEQVRATLRLLGVARVPRGPMPATRSNPAGLTGRQLDVVELMAQGMTNAEIADHLVVSVRTVDSHVSAALDKLDVRTRKQAVAKARTLGIT